jgi:hypothetical protein
MKISDLLKLGHSEMYWTVGVFLTLKAYNCSAGKMYQTVARRDGSGRIVLKLGLCK